MAPWLEARFRALEPPRDADLSDRARSSRIGLEGWRELGARETFILRESRVPTSPPETDLFAGLTRLSDAAPRAPPAAADIPRGDGATWPRAQRLVDSHDRPLRPVLPCNDATYAASRVSP